MAKKSFKKNGSLFRGETNPFNVKVNRKKHSVLGLKVRGTKGLPGVSKGLSQAKRKEFLQKSRIQARKSNRYHDKRLLDESLPVEDRVTARFVHERQKKGKKNIFNLNDEEELTHHGKPLNDINSFDNHASGSEEEEQLNADFVSKAHFGGFASESNFEKPKSHKELLEQLIIESKQKKREMKVEREQYIASQEIIDKEWKEIHFSSAADSVSNQNKKLMKPISSKEVKDPFDISKYELKFEPKGVSITHTKSAEEIAREEQDRMIKLEQEKLARMGDHNALNNSKLDTHMSADGIYDYFEYLQPVLDEEKNEEIPSSRKGEEEVSDSDESVDSEASNKQEGDILDTTIEDEEEDIGNSLKNGLSQDMNFKTLVETCDAEQVYNVVEEILKPTLKSKNEKVLSKLGNFFGILIQYALECCEGKLSKIEQAGVLLPHMHSLATAVPCVVAEKFLDILDQEQQIFEECKKQNLKRDFPRLQALVVLRYAQKIYSASDFRHPVVTPSVIFMCDILSSKFCNTYINILSRLLVSEIMLDCIADSKRFVPEAINFLVYVLKLAALEENTSQTPSTDFRKFTLFLTEKSSADCVQLNILQSSKALSAEQKKVGIISEAILQLRRFASLYTDLPSFKEIFSPAVLICSNLPIQLYSTTLQESIQNFVQFVQRDSPLRQLVFQNVKPKPLKMFEPSFSSKFDRKDNIEKKRKLLKQVSQKIRKEEKCMLREIRRDTQVVASEWLREKLESDAERKRKVKEIYGELATQEGEFKKMMKKKS